MFRHIALTRPRERPWLLQGLRRQPLRLILLCWIGVFVLFFTLVRNHLPNYMLPTCSAAAVLMGKAMVVPKDALGELPPAILPHLVVHLRVCGMDARRMLFLLSLRPGEAT